MIREHLDTSSFRNLRSAAQIAARKNGFEVCGAIIREESGILTLRPLKNLASAPAKWEIELEWLREIRREMKCTARKLVGTYHSHVGDYAYPSEKDLDYYPSAFLMMIYDIQDRRVGMWKPLIRKGTARLRAVAVTCDSPRWDERTAQTYAEDLLRKFGLKEKRTRSPNRVAGGN